MSGYRYRDSNISKILRLDHQVCLKSCGTVCNFQDGDNSKKTTTALPTDEDKKIWRSLGPREDDDVALRFGHGYSCCYGRYRTLLSEPDDESEGFIRRTNLFSYTL